MKQYQVTKKLQVTIPKKLAEKTGIKPGDAVIFEEAGGTISLRRAGEARTDSTELRSVIEEFAGDLRSIRPRLKEAEKALVEDLSRHLASE